MVDVDTRAVVAHFDFQVIGKPLGSGQKFLGWYGHLVAGFNLVVHRALQPLGDLADSGKDVAPRLNNRRHVNTDGTEQCMPHLPHAVHLP